MKTYPA